MNANTTTLLNGEQDRIMALLRLAQWAAEASPAITQITHLRDQVPSFRAAFDPLTPGLTFPEIRNAGQLVADVLAVAIDLMESREGSGQGSAA